VVKAQEQFYAELACASRRKTDMPQDKIDAPSDDSHTPA